MRNRLLFLLLVMLLPADLAAQAAATPQLPAGARVRVRLSAEPGEWYHGKVTAVDGDTLALEPPARIPFAAMQRLEVSRGKRRALWAAGGTLLGGAVGVIATRATNQPDPADIGGMGNTARGVGNTLLGMLAGGIAGFFLAPERWQEVSLPGR